MANQEHECTARDDWKELQHVQVRSAQHSQRCGLCEVSRLSGVTRALLRDRQRVQFRQVVKAVVCLLKCACWVSDLQRNTAADVSNHKDQAGDNPLCMERE